MMSKIIYLSNIDRRSIKMQTAIKDLQAEGLLSPDAVYLRVKTDSIWTEKMDRTLADADLVLMKLMGGSLDTPFFRRLLVYLREHRIKYYINTSGAREDNLQGGLQEAEMLQFKKYDLYNGMPNFRNMLLYAQFLCDDKTGYAQPEHAPWCGIYHPDAKQVYTDLAAYCKDFCKEGAATVGILFYRDEWIWGDLGYQEALVREVERQGLNAVCVFTNGMPDLSVGMPSLPEVFRKLFMVGDRLCIDVLINTLKFSLSSGQSGLGTFLQTLNVPFLQAYTLLTDYASWADNFEGMNPMEISISVTSPEFDGVIHGVPVANKTFLKNGDIHYQPIEERITSMVKKAAKWASLRRKANREKKVAIIFHNYPPSNASIGSAVGLDSIESVRLLLLELQRQGYQIPYLPASGKELLELITHNATNDMQLLNEQQVDRAAKLSDAQYQQYFDSLPGTNRKQMEKDWGPAPGQVMNFEGRLLVPGTMDGNIFITVQPPRGFGADQAKVYHSPFVAPTHHYLAFYQWLRDVWGADAVVHVGTHGNLEWLPGKSAGLDNKSYPDLALVDLPNIYPYLMTITGEGIQAKRRGSACLIEYLPPPQTQAGTYDDLAEVEKMLDEYSHFAITQPENLVTLQKLLLEKVQAANLQAEMPYDDKEPFAEYAGRLHNYITDLKNMQVRTGLHVLGQPPAAEQLLDFLLLLTRLPNGEVPSLLETVAAAQGYDYQSLLQDAGKVDAKTGLTGGQLVDRCTAAAKEFLRSLAAVKFDTQAVSACVTQLFGSDKTEAVSKVGTYICTTVYPALARTTQEMSNAVRALDGNYIEPGPSGAPTSGGAYLLPSGRNFFGVDPRNLPTPVAWKLGQDLGDAAITRFIAEEGRYPESVGIVLWSGANMRSHGQCVAEFLYLLGVKPVWQSGSQRVTGVTVLPLATLKRPRIDVTARISGLFRDTMPGVMELLDKAVLLVGNLQEKPEQNYIRKHLLEDSKELTATGMAQEDAWRQAAYRIFGDELGTYGAGVAALLENKNWQTVDDIADVYVRWGAHAYGGKNRGQFLPQIFKKRMSTIDIAIKNEDNHETNMLSSDDYNAYHGGMVATVRSIKGSAPKAYCGDSTNRDRVELHSVQEQAKRIFRSEAVNPKFIEGMMQHGYKGAADMANYISHSFQWDATSEVMDDWMYEKYAEKYTLDPQVQKWLREVNPWALQRMAAILLEAEQREMWHAKPETKEALQKIYLSIEGELEDKNDEDD